MNIAETVTKLVHEQLHVPIEEVTPEKSFLGDLKADSLDLVELVMSMEETFKIEIPDEDHAKIMTVGDAIKYIEAAKAGG